MATSLRPALVALLSILIVPGCATERGRPRSAPALDLERPLAPLAEAVTAWSSDDARTLAFEDLLERLAGEDVVFLGETHLDDTTHRVELAVLEGLLERRAGKVVLSLEMFERDVQATLDQYLAGAIDEAAFLSKARPWGNYRTDYRPLIECAKRHGIPVIAANAPAALRRKVTAGGSEALVALSAEERRHFPAEILPAEAAYWQRVDRATRGHMNFASLPDEKRLYSGQNLWDNCMGAACADALAAHPETTVVHVVGGFHVMYSDGTARQFRLRAPRARAKVVEILSVPDASAARPEKASARADYLVYAAERARSVSDGALAVSIGSELRYSLDVPATADGEHPAPLLVWLPDGEERPEDARTLLRAMFGEALALAVVTPPFPERCADLGPGGRWSRANALNADLGALQTGLERLVEYATRRLPVSGEHVVLGGNGSGATAVLWCAMYSEWLSATCFALEPRGARALQLEGLPDDAPATRKLVLAAATERLEELRWLEKDYTGIGVTVALSSEPLEALVRNAFELGPRPSANQPAEWCVLERDLPRARQWAELFARRRGDAARVVTANELGGDEDPARVHRLAVGGEWPLTSFAEGQGIPLAPGDFGGTTVLVVPAGADEATRAAWLALEAEKALKKRSPFAGLRVAFEEGGPSLAAVLAELRAGEARSVLVVPATFCATGAEMQRLAGTLDRAILGELELEWLPGLGGELCSGADD
jgi:uncharacterized iron-regulated protein